MRRSQRLGVFSQTLLVGLLASCEAPPRFAPPPLETTRPARTLPSSEPTSVETAIGTTPDIPPPSLRCMKVGEDGRLISPSLSALSTYHDELACLVKLPTGAPYDRVTLQMRTAAGVSLLAEASLAARTDGTRERLFWLPVKLWREAALEQKNLTIEAVFPCEEPITEEGFGCDLTLSQSFVADPVPREEKKEPKSIKGKGPLIQELRCNAYDAWGYLGGSLVAGDASPPSARCEVFIENPLEEALSNVLIELRAGPPKGSARVISSRLLGTLPPKAKLSTQLHAPLEGLTGAVVISVHVGRNATERNATKASLSLQAAPPPPASLPASAPAEPEPTD